MSKLKCLIMDVDGTLTDGKIYMGASGEICKTFNIKDGCGIKDILIPRGIIPVIITGRESKIVENRCRELGITELYQGVSDKVKQLYEIIDKYSISFFNCAYIGDDINDFPCLKLIKDAGGLVGCPSDAAKQIIKIADFVSIKKGGDGAARDFIEWLIRE